MNSFNIMFYVWHVYDVCNCFTVKVSVSNFEVEKVKTWTTLSTFLTGHFKKRKKSRFWIFKKNVKTYSRTMSMSTGFSVYGPFFTARTIFTRTSGAFMVTCTRTTQHVSTDNLWLNRIDRPRNPVRWKDLGDIYYTSRVIVVFVSNLVAMATGVGRGRICLTSFNSPTHKTPY